MTFKLEKKSANRVLVKYHITNARGDICGSVNVSPEEKADLLKHWREPAPAAATASARHQPAVNAISAALRRGPRMNKEAVLRGC
jgi:dihydrodipicolinate synthase/N-acetylneuraminate lyase